MTPSAVLLVSRGGSPRSAHFLHDSLVVGGSPECDVVLDDPEVAPRHLVVHWSPSGLEVRDITQGGRVAFPSGPATSGILRPHESLRICSHELAAVPVEPRRSDPTASTMPARRELEALYFLSNRFEFLSSLESLLAAVIEKLALLFQAERATILVDEPGHGLRPVLEHDRCDRDRPLSFSQTAARSVMEKRRPLLLVDTSGGDPLGQVESIQAAGVRSVLCAPLVVGERIFGVVYLDSRIRARAYDESDRDLLDGFTRNVSRAVATLRERDEMRLDVQSLRRLQQDRDRDDGRHLAGHPVSPGMRRVMEQVDLVAREDATVLLVGESGTGKEILARAIHDRSPRRGHCFVPVNVMALSESVVESELFGHERGAFTGARESRPGRFEMAHRGTLFLDEIGELSLALQVKLLRVLEGRTIERVGSGTPVPVDFRLVTATNARFDELIATGRFRRDLYYRLNVFAIEIPPLRERPEDIDPLVRGFIAMFGARSRKAIEGIERDAMALLEAYAWPGNIRELRNVIERAFVIESGRLITPESLPFDLVAALPDRATPGPSPPSPGPGDAGSAAARVPPAPDGGTATLETALARRERELVLSALERHRGNVTRAAEELGITRKTLYKRMAAYGAAASDF